MKLHDYLVQTGETPLQFGRRIGLKQPNSIYRYLRGDRMPTPFMMQAIVRATNGQVTPNDFYGLTAG